MELHQKTVSNLQFSGKAAALSPRHYTDRTTLGIKLCYYLQEMCTTKTASKKANFAGNTYPVISFRWQERQQAITPHSLASLPLGNRATFHPATTLPIITVCVIFDVSMAVTSAI
jgi:hypothetical protein